jgi:hypothetical protein
VWSQKVLNRPKRRLLAPPGSREGAERHADPLPPGAVGPRYAAWGGAGRGLQLPQSRNRCKCRAAQSLSICGILSPPERAMRRVRASPRPRVLGPQLLAPGAGLDNLGVARRHRRHLRERLPPDRPGHAHRVGAARAGARGTPATGMYRHHGAQHWRGHTMIDKRGYNIREGTP